MRGRVDPLTDEVAVVQRVLVLDHGSVRFDEPERLASIAAVMWIDDDIARCPLVATADGSVRCVGTPPGGAQLVEPTIDDGYLLLTHDARVTSEYRVVVAAPSFDRVAFSNVRGLAMIEARRCDAPASGSAGRHGPGRRAVSPRLAGAATTVLLPVLGDGWRLHRRRSHRSARRRHRPRPRGGGDGCEDRGGLLGLLMPVGLALVTTIGMRSCAVEEALDGEGRGAPTGIAPARLLQPAQVARRRWGRSGSTFRRPLIAVLAGAFALSCCSPPTDLEHSLFNAIVPMQIMPLRPTSPTCPRAGTPRRMSESERYPRGA
jgi:hypothetical protein